MFTLVSGLLVPFVGSFFARAIVVALIGAAIAAPFAYTYRQGYVAGKERCEKLQREAFDAAQKEADNAARELQKNATQAEDANADAEQNDTAQLPALAAAIERGASAAQCIDADSMRLIAGSGDADVAAARVAGSRAARSK